MRTRTLQIILLSFISIYSLKAQEVIENIDLNTGSRTYQFTNFIEAPSDESKPVTISNNAKVEFISSKWITLKPGFEVSSLTSEGFFNGKIDVTINVPDLESGPVGGGFGYNRITYLDSQYETVSTFEQLKTKIANGVNKIYVISDIKIPVDEQLLIDKDNITIAGNRGTISGYQISYGNKIYCDEKRNTHENPAIRITGNNVRITGLRIEGPDDKRYSSAPNTLGILIIQCANAEIDNCEIYNWPYAAVSTWQANNILIHHNFIHHNQEEGIGYGVCSGNDSKSIKIDHNIFDYNRHHTAATTHGNEEYDATNNVFLENQYIYTIDAHPYFYDDDNDTSTVRITDGRKTAGNKFIIDNNTFFYTGAENTILICGKPWEQSFITNNYFSQNCPVNITVKQKTFTNEKYHGEVNLYPYEFLDVSNNHMSQPNKLAFISWSGRNNWHATIPTHWNADEIAVADFNGDGKSDLLATTGTEFLLSSGTQFNWENWTNSGWKISDGLVFRDIDRNGTIDICVKDSESWYILKYGSSVWEDCTSCYNGMKSEPVFTDFDGDGIFDDFRATGTRFEALLSTTSSWEYLANSEYTESYGLKFGDFNGDNITDIIIIDLPGDYIESLPASNSPENEHELSVTNFESINDLNKSVIIFPNPIKNMVNITIKNYEINNGNITIFNNVGIKIYNKSISNNNICINLTNQPKGIYFVRIKLNKEIIAKKLVIK